MRSEEDDDTDDDSIELSCMHCDHDLNHRAYRICKHPRLPIPVCLPCFEELAELDHEEAVGASCSWCFDGGLLFECGDGGICSHAFCQDCILAHFGQEKIDEISACEDWKCLICDSAPLQEFQDLLIQAQQHSMYSRDSISVLAKSVEESGAAVSYVHEDIDLHDDICRLRIILQESNRALEKLDNEEVDRQRLAIAAEVGDDSELIEEELSIYCEKWQTHHEIMSRQELEVMEFLELHDFDVNRLPEHANEAAAMDDDEVNRDQDADLERISAHSTPTSTSSSRDAVLRARQERLAKEAADREIDRRKKTIASSKAAMPTSSSLSSSSVSTNGNHSSAAADVAACEFIEAVTEPEDEQALRRRELLAAQDEVVQLYADEEVYSECACDLYPPSFENLLPKSVIKALYHSMQESRSDDTVHLCRKFSIPQHVCIVLQHCHKPAEQSLQHWSFARTVHPSVLRALYYSSNPCDCEVLARRYGLSEDVCEVVDCGAAEDIFALHRNKVQRTKPIAAVEKSDVMSCLRHEERLVDIMFSEKQQSSLKQSKSEVEDAGQESEKSYSRMMEYVAGTASRAAATTSPTPRIAYWVPVDEDEVALSQSSQPKLTSSSDRVAVFQRNCRQKKLATAKILQSEKRESESKSTSSHAKVVHNIRRQVQAADDADGFYLQQRRKLAKEANRPANFDEVDKMLEDNDDKIAENDNRNDQEDDRDVDGLMDSEDSDSDKKKHMRRLLKSKKRPLDDNEQAAEQPADKRNKEAQGVSTSAKFTTEVKATVVGSVTKQQEIICIDDSDDDEDDFQVTSCSKAAIVKPSSSSSSSAVSRPAGKGNVGPSRRVNSDNDDEEDDDNNNNNDDDDSVADRVARHLKKNAAANAIVRLNTSQRSPYHAKKILTEADILELFVEKKGEGFVLNKKSERDGEIQLPASLAPQLKEHQREAVRFMWENVVGSVKQLKLAKSGGGCVLAHCMGLGKTLSVISLITTLLAHPTICAIKHPMPGSAASSSAGADNDSQSQSSPGGGNWMSNMPAVVAGRRMLHTVLVVAPLNTLINWEKEFAQWVPIDLSRHLRVTVLQATESNINERVGILRQWQNQGGVLVMSYNLFRSLTLAEVKGKVTAKHVAEIQKFLISPGPDICVADEAHTIKEKSSQISKILSKIATKRRIALTGSPIQNNLIEYWVMVNWVKPHFLGRVKEFTHRYVRPIKLGECSDASASAVKHMHKRSFLLHKKLKPIINRKDLNELSKDLKPKREFVVTLRMTGFQKFLYQKFLSDVVKSGIKNVIFKAYQSLLRVWNHPACTVLRSIQSEGSKTPSLTDVMRQLGPTVGYFEQHRQELLKNVDRDNKLLDATMFKSGSELLSRDDKKKSKASSNCNLNDNDDNDNDDSERISDSSTNNDDEGDDEEEEQDEDDDEVMVVCESSPEKAKVKVDSPKKVATANAGAGVEVEDGDLPDLPEGVQHDWWRCPGSKAPDNFNIADMAQLSSKLIAFLSILVNSVLAGDKVLLFSQSIFSLDVIEMILRSPCWGDIARVNNRDDIQSASLFSRWSLGAQYTRIDGRVSDRQRLIDNFNRSKATKLFLISTKAGNMGVNLQSANRVIIFDSSWNPAHDLQAIYRSYRYGQTKNVFVYRLLAAGSMEQKIYKNQVQKQALSNRVVDAQVPDNHFTEAERAHFMTFEDEEGAGAGSKGTGEVTETKAARCLEEMLTMLRSGTEDSVLIKYVEQFQSSLSSIEDHEILLEDKVEAHLTEAEEQEAEWEFQQEFAPPPPPPPQPQAAVVTATATAGATAMSSAVAATASLAAAIGKPSISTLLDMDKASKVLYAARGQMKQQLQQQQVQRLHGLAASAAAMAAKPNLLSLLAGSGAPQSAGASRPSSTESIVATTTVRKTNTTAATTQPQLAPNISSSSIPSQPVSAVSAASVPALANNHTGVDVSGDDEENDQDQLEVVEEEEAEQSQSQEDSSVEALPLPDSYTDLVDDDL